MKNNKKPNSQIGIDNLMDDAVKNALIRRHEDLLTLTDEQAQSISGGATSLPPTVHGVVINPNPQPTPCHPIVLGVVVHGVVPISKPE